MATALAAQLAQLAADKPAQERYVRGKSSLLFDYQKAADVSVEQILNIARTGEEPWDAAVHFNSFLFVFIRCLGYLSGGCMAAGVVGSSCSRSLGYLLLVLFVSL